MQIVPCSASLSFSSLLLVLLAALLGLGGTTQDQPTGAASIAAVGRRFAKPLLDLQPLGLHPGKKALERIAELSRVEVARLREAVFYFGSDASESSARVITLPLAGALEGASIALAIDDAGKLVDGFLFGRADVDEDEQRTWRRIVEQFAWNDVAVRRPADADIDLDPQAYWSELSEDASDDARWTRVLYETRRLMIGNSDFYQRVELAAKRGEPLAAEWLESYLASFDRLAEIGAEMQPQLSAAASTKYQSSAGRVRRIVADMAAAAREGEREAVFEPFQRMQGACFGCHDIRGHDLGFEGPLVFPGLDERLPELGLRRDLFRVGMDVWAPPGQAESAQEIADAVQAALLLVGSTE